MSRTSKVAVAVSAIAVAITSAEIASADSLPSCARKFVGSWDWTSSTGIYTHHNFSLDGYANCSGNSFCTRNESWSCRGNQFIYNNGMGETVLTLSADGRVMKGMGGVPPNLQTVVRSGTVGHLQDADPEAISLMKRAKAAEAYCNYSSQMRASDNYYAAARIFARQGDSGQQTQAEAAGKAASYRADECGKKRTVGRVPPKTNESCKKAQKQADMLEAAGGDVTSLRAKLQSLGCTS